MDILQQSLKAADILSGDDNDDLFRELGLTCNPSETSALPNEIQSLVSQFSSVPDNLGGSTSDLISNFDTSQFLNTTTSVNVASVTPTCFSLSASSSDPLGVVASNNSELYPVQNLTHATSGQIKLTDDFNHMPETSLSSVPNNLLAVVSSYSQPMSKAIATVATDFDIGPCSSVFSKVVTHTSTSSVQMRPATPSGHSQQYSISQPMQIPTPIQVLQPSSGVQPSGGTQLMTVVQKPTVNGMVVQSQPNNVAVLKIAAPKHGLNLNDPQVLKAITANIIQKRPQQEARVQHTQPQFIKLASQNNTLINVISQRPQLNGSPSIALQNGQKILLNNGQQVQLCTTQATGLQTRIDTQNSHVPIISQAIGSIPQTIKSGAIKGIQIASVSIPIGTSSSTTVLNNVGSAQGNTVLTIPVVSRSDTSHHTVTHTSTVVGPVTTVSGSAHSSATVRGLLANAISKPTNPPVIGTNPQLANGVIPMQGQPGAMLRLNISPQQASQLTLQALIKQHQESSMQEKASVQSSSTLQRQPKQSPAPQGQLTPVTRPPLTTPVVATSTTGPSDRFAVQVFKVDVTITDAQVEEVKRLLTTRTIASKLNTLTKEQRQLVLAFQAQIKTMSPPVQQYYLRNPQLFMQKVLQQTRNGKPFILQVKTEALQKSKISNISGTIQQSLKSQHPTISLTNEPSRSPVSASRVSTPPPISTVASSSIPESQKIQQNRVISIHSSSTIPRTTIKRSVPSEPSAKVTLIMEQLERHKNMVIKPDCNNRFSSFRDAIRRLIPYHTCNIPDIEQKAFDKSEKTFDEISNRIAAKTKAMMNKYHLLCLKDSTRDSCSADMVMIERMFLQKEKVKYAEDKARLKENPDLISEYFPKQKLPVPAPYQFTEGEVGTSEESVNAAENNGTLSSTGSYIDIHGGSLQNVISPESNLDNNSVFRTSNGKRCISRDSDSSSYAKRSKTCSTDSTPQRSAEDSLLLEAVDSIL